MSLYNNHITLPITFIVKGAEWKKHLSVSEILWKGSPNIVILRIFCIEPARSKFIKKRKYRDLQGLCSQIYLLYE